MTERDGENLCVVVFVELAMHERVEGVPVRVDDVSGDRPQIAEDERRADDRVQLGRFGVEVDTLRHDQKALQQFAQRHHLADVHLTDNQTQQVTRWSQTYNNRILFDIRFDSTSIPLRFVFDSTGVRLLIKGH